jgi:hypothetical protein
MYSGKPETAQVVIFLVYDIKGTSVMVKTKDRQVRLVRLQRKTSFSFFVNKQTNDKLQFAR